MSLQKFAFIFGTRNSGFMATEQELAEIKQKDPDSQATLHWYEVPKVDALLKSTADLAFDNGYESGLSQGRKEGQAKLETYVNLVDHTQADLDRAYQDGQKFVEERVRSIQQTAAGDGTRTNQLLNELYHDRARLEKTLQISLATVDQFLGDVQKLVAAMSQPGNKTKGLRDNVRISGTAVGQLLDTFKDVS